MMHIAFSPYFHKIYKFLPIFVKFTFFWLNWRFFASPILTILQFMRHALHVLDAPVHLHQARYDQRDHSRWNETRKQSTASISAIDFVWNAKDFLRLIYLIAISPTSQSRPTDTLIPWPSDRPSVHQMTRSWESHHKDLSFASHLSNWVDPKFRGHGVRTLNYK